MAMTQAEAVATLDAGQDQLDALLSRLDDAQVEAPATIGDGDWSARDLLAHIAFWEELALEAAVHWRAGQVPSIETVFLENGVDRLNADNQQRSRNLTLVEVRERAAAAHQALRSLVSDLTRSEWTARAPYETERRESLGMMLGAITGAPRRGFGHAFAHLPDLEAYVNRLGRWAPREARHGAPGSATPGCQDL